MTTYDDGLLAAQFAELAPEPLEGRWDDVLREAIGARDDRRRLTRFAASQGRRRYLVALVAAAALIVLVGTASAIGGIRDFILDRGFAGLPPVGAAPSTPESGELVLHFRGKPINTSGGYEPTIETWVYADGRIIWSRTGSRPSSQIPEGATELASGYLEQGLTPEGVELLRSEVAGLLDRNRVLVVPLPSDYEAVESARRGGLPFFYVKGPYGSEGQVEVRDGDRFVGLYWEAWENEVSRPEGTGPIATPEQASDALRLNSILTEPSSALPASAWAVPKIRAYVPTHYQVCMNALPQNDVSDVLALLPAPAAESLRGKGLEAYEFDLIEPGGPGGGTDLVVVGRGVNYCATLTTEEAREVAEPLSGRDHDPRFNQAILGYRLATPADPTNLDATKSIWFEPYLPHGQITDSSGG